jgi:hypothetical protein
LHTQLETAHSFFLYRIRSLRQRTLSSLLHTQLETTHFSFLYILSLCDTHT